MPIVAGDLCHGRCLDPMRTDRYSIEQRGRVLRLLDEARRKFAHVLAVAGNHDHYDGVFEVTAGLLRRHLPGVTVLDEEAIEIGGIRFFGSTLWTDFENGDTAAMDAVQRRMGEYFLVKVRSGREDGLLGKFQPEHALAEHRVAWDALGRIVQADSKPTVVIKHHSPSLLGLNPKFCGNGLDPAYAGSRDTEIAAFDNVPVWVQGHTHVARTYHIGSTIVRSKALGCASKRHGAARFSVKASVDIGLSGYDLVSGSST